MHIDTLAEWCIKRKIKISSEKSQTLVMHNGRTHPEEFGTLDGKDIPWKTEVKYLGIIIGNKLKFRKHCQNVRTIARAARATSAPHYYVRRNSMGTHRQSIQENTTKQSVRNGIIFKDL